MHLLPSGRSAAFLTAALLAAALSAALLASCSEQPPEPPEQQPEQPPEPLPEPLPELKACADDADQIRLYTAAAIRTMNPRQPLAEAIALDADRIAAVGSIADIRRQLKDRPLCLDSRFADRVLMPGFIDNHIHPLLGGLQLDRTHIIAWHQWDTLKTRSVPVRNREQYLARLREVEQAMDDPDQPLITWGFNHLLHGGYLYRKDLDKISRSRPIVVWHASTHDMFLNSKALKWLKVNKKAAKRIEGIQTDKKGKPNGVIREYQAIGYVFEILGKTLFGEDDAGAAGAIAHIAGLVHQGGITSVGELVFGALAYPLEKRLFRAVLDQPNVPFRTRLVVNAAAAVQQAQDDPAAAGDPAAWLRQQAGGFADSQRLSMAGIKLFADGAFVSQGMQLRPPGWPDGHSGTWGMEPDNMTDLMRPWWNAGVDIHIHSNGDASHDAVLDALDTLMQEKPRTDHRTTLHHFGISTKEQIQRLAGLGGNVSANGYYPRMYGEIFLKWELDSLIPNMTRLKSLHDAGVRYSVHSDIPIAPLNPLLAVWITAKRKLPDGTILGEHERVPVEVALRSVTIDAAYALRLENEVGSLETGKKADLVILSADPMQVPLDDIPGISVLGTVFEGRHFPLPSGN